MSALLVGLTGCGDPAGNDMALTAEAVEQSREDWSSIYDTDCYASRKSPDLTAEDIDNCTRTHPESDFTVAMVGDSHATQWLAPVEKIAEQESWKLRFFGKRGCSVGYYLVENNEGSPYATCTEWNEKLMSPLLEESYDVVLISSFSLDNVIEDGITLDGKANEAARAKGMASAWQRIVDNGSDVVVILDTPYLGFSAPNCLLENLENPNKCSTDYQTAVVDQPHPDVLAAEQVPEVETIEMSDQYCPSEARCYGYLRNNLVYRDKDHTTASFALTMQGVLSKRLSETSAFNAHM